MPVYINMITNKNNIHLDCVAGKPRKLMGASCESPGGQFLSCINLGTEYIVRKNLLAGIYQYDNK